jgi:hypothetical protein
VEKPYSWIQSVGFHVIFLPYVLDVVVDEAFGHLIHFVSLGRPDFVLNFVCTSRLLGNNVGVSIAHDVLDANHLFDA